MKVYGKSTRFHERIKLNIPLHVIYRENEEVEWAESAVTERVTICGIGFAVSRPLEPKRLIRFKLPMPRRFRLYDYAKEFYEVWGNVRYLRLTESVEIDRICLQVGAALVGARPPKSFLSDPKTRYDLKPVLRDEHFWETRELPRRSGRFVRSDEERRAFEKSVVIELIDKNGFKTGATSARTVNISESGTAVLAQLKNLSPAYVLIKTPDGDHSLLAAVRGVHETDSDEISRLHLEFITGKWMFD